MPRMHSRDELCADASQDTKAELDEHKSRTLKSAGYQSADETQGSLASKSEALTTLRRPTRAPTRFQRLT